VNINYRYPWPASSLSADDMALLHNARESSEPRTPITKLIAKAIRKTYGVPATTENHNQ
jgi:hypothetical protein